MTNIRMPQTGEAWRHNKTGEMYAIVGTARRSDGTIDVVYTPYSWWLGMEYKLYTRPLAEFLDTNSSHEPRFIFEREAGPENIAPFINPQIWQ